MRYLHIATKTSLRTASMVNVSTGILCRSFFFLSNLMLIGIWRCSSFGYGSGISAAMWLESFDTYDLCGHENTNVGSTVVNAVKPFSKHTITLTTKRVLFLLLPSPQWFCVFKTSISLSRQWPFTLWFHLRNVNIIQGKWKFREILHVIVQNTLNE